MSSAGGCSAICALSRLAMQQPLEMITFTAVRPVGYSTTARRAYSTCLCVLDKLVLQRQPGTKFWSHRLVRQIEAICPSQHLIQLGPSRCRSPVDAARLDRDCSVHGRHGRMCRASLQRNPRTHGRDGGQRVEEDSIISRIGRRRGGQRSPSYIVLLHPPECNVSSVRPASNLPLRMNVKQANKLEVRREEEEPCGQVPEAH